MGHRQRWIFSRWTSPIAAYPALTAQLINIGERVQCRNRGFSWGWGYVTSIEPLKVTVEDQPDAYSCGWDEVRKAPPEDEVAVIEADDETLGLLDGLLVDDDE